MSEHKPLTKKHRDGNVYWKGIDKHEPLYPRFRVKDAVAGLIEDIEKSYWGLRDKDIWGEENIFDKIRKWLPDVIE